MTRKMGEPDRMRQADVSIANGAISTFFSVMWLFGNFAFLMVTTIGFEDVPKLTDHQISLAHWLMGSCVIPLFILCFVCFKNIYSLFKRSDSLWFYLTAMVADIIIFFIVELIFLKMNGLV